MNFNITVVALDRVTKPTAKGSYQQLEVAFKNLDNGKLESKKLMSFVKPDNAYKALNDASVGNQFTITSLKKEGDQYWTWTEAVALAPGVAPTASTGTANGNTVPSPTRSTYETSEERAKKQIYIVKQSSLAQAVALLTHNNPKTPVHPGDVMEMAQLFTDFVFSDKKVSVLDMPSDMDDIQVD